MFIVRVIEDPVDATVMKEGTGVVLKSYMVTVKGKSEQSGVK